MSNYKRLINFIKPYWQKLLMAIFCITMSAAANLYVPWIIKDMIDDVLTNRNLMLLNMLCLGIVVVFLLRGIFFYGQSYLVSFIAQKVIIDIRETLYGKFQKLQMSYYDKRQTGTIMSYITNDVSALQVALVDSLIEMVTETSILVGSLIMMFYLDWKLSLVTLFVVPIIGQAMKIFGRKLKSSGSVIQERTADITSLLQESISGVRVIKSFAREDYEMDRFQKQNTLNFKANMKAVQLTSLLTPTVEFLAAIIVAVILWFGGYQVINGALTAGALIAFLTYAVNLANPVKRLSRVYGTINKAMAAAERVFEVIDIDEDLKDNPNAKDLVVKNGEVVFSDVSFSYKNDDNYVLKNLNIDAKPGEMIAFVGPSGAGKTTIANLIPRFYDVTLGSIKIDNVDIRDVKIKSLREQIGVVPQETMLFSGSVMENIRYGRLNATDEEVIKAAVAANAHQFIEKLPKGYETTIGERGLMLSGGQRQRIAIARAILKDPRILILDEATSALDTESEKLVQEALNTLMKNRTSFVIAHRLSTIVHADKIVVLNHGKIAEIGSHKDLLNKGGLYANLYNIQYNNKKVN